MQHLRIYQLLFGVSIVANVGIATACVFAPAWFAGMVGLHWDPEIGPFCRAWGGTLLALHTVYLPGLTDPLGQRWINLSSIAIKLGMPLVFLTNGPGFLPFALWDLGWAAVLAAYWWILWRAAR
jgi:hypothetical protein